MPSEGTEIPVGSPEEPDLSPEVKKLEGLELIQSQVKRLSVLIQAEYNAENPNSPEEEEEFQGYMRKWVAEYQRLAQAGPERQPEALEVLDMIERLFGDLPIEEGLFPKDIYDTLPPESPAAES